MAATASNWRFGKMAAVAPQTILWEFARYYPAGTLVEAATSPSRSGGVRWMVGGKPARPNNNKNFVSLHEIKQMKKICLFTLKLLHYKIDLAHIPTEKKYVLVFAPHTSWTDFIVGKIALTAMDVKAMFLIKKEIFFFPLGVWLRYIGGYPVDRKRAQKLTDTIAEFIKEKDEIVFLIAPEGTRRCTETWKRGFYYIAQKAGVPIALAYLDYHDRKGGIGPIFYPTGDYEADLQEIQKFYCGMEGKKKGRFNLENKTI